MIVDWRLTERSVDPDLSGMIEGRDTMDERRRFMIDDWRLEKTI